MRILLDECLDRRLGAGLTGHDAIHAARMGWAGLSNGELLERAQHEFDAFLTVDRNLSYQQNLERFAIAVVVMRAATNRLADLQPLVAAVLDALPTAPKGRATVIESRDD